MGVNDRELYRVAMREGRDRRRGGGDNGEWKWFGVGKTVNCKNWRGWSLCLFCS